MNMRKIIAVLAAVLLLCAAIPMAAISVSAADAVYSADFEDGTVTGWSSSTSSVAAAADIPVANADGGNYALKFVSTNYSYTNYTISVAQNTTYKVTFSILSETAGYPIISRVRTSSSVDIAKETYNPSATAWETYSYTFNSGSNTTLNFRFQTGWSTGTYYIDNITIVPLEGDVSDDGHIQNGNFETGDNLNWVNSANTAVVADPTGAGQGYVMQTSETANVTMFSQTAMNLEQNTYYELSFKVYCYTPDDVTYPSTSAFWVRFANSITDWSVSSTLASAKYNDYTPRINVNTNKNAWYDVRITFNTGSLTETVINFMNYRSGSGYYYFDDIKVMLPPEAPAVPDDAIYFEDFESGHTWISNSTNSPLSLVGVENLPVANATSQYIALGQTVASGDYPYMADKTGFTVTPNTDYVLSFEALNTSANWPIMAVVAPNYWLGSAIFTTVSGKVTPATHSWETYTVTFNSGDNTKLYVGLKSQWANTTVYFDNVWIAPLNGDVTDDGYLTDGDFEHGNGIGWLHTDNTAIVADPTESGQGNVMSIDENTGSVHMFSQVAQNLIAGETYTLSFKVYGYASVTNSAFFLKFPSTCSNFSWGGDLVGYAYSTYVNRFNVNSNTGKWMTATVTFTTSDTVAVLDFQNYRGNAGQYYFDDIVLTHNHNYVGEETTAPTCGEAGEKTYTCVCGDSYTEEIAATGEHTYANDYDADCDVCGAVRAVVNPIAFGGNSRSEDVSGLAFKFDVAVDGMAVNGTEAIYDGATIDGNKLISMGAIVSNAKSELDIAAVYLCDLEADSASFAVRVINIPEANYGDEITAVPYFVVEIDGVETTVYGEAQVASYNG